MDLPSYLTTLRNSWLLLLVTALVGLGAGTAAYLVTPKTYASTVDFWVSTPTSSNTNPQSSSQFAESRVNSYILLLSSEQLAQRVVTSSRVDLAPLQVASRITASAKINTVVVSTTVTDSSPDRSLAIARGVAASFGPLVDDLDNAGRSTPVVVIHTVSGPTLQAAPVSPDVRLYLGAGLLGGLLLGLVLALVRTATARRPSAPRHAAPTSTEHAEAWAAQQS